MGSEVTRVDRVRARNGRYAKSSDTAERDAEACRLRLRGMAYSAIAEQLGFADQGHAYTAVKRAMDAIIREPAEQVREQELLRLDALWARALAIAERFHVTVAANGKVVYTKGGAVEDDGPALQAIDRLLKIQDRRARYLGLDAPTKTEVRHVDAVDAEIEQLVQRLANMASSGQAADAATATPAGDAGAVRHPG